ncbi:PLP-dependent aminotransferase family protein [Pseudothauera nasutitermitis]|uniref:PLP-dependent aminotransferase family protein n=1 Tax=Pseudothauera nasutitermitis TaxID=2565930 RepID=A0A4S4ATF1_9RHOO|nr:PLP-dependent aminotransferase family protein [Pseudothauera nasutitermitis]THF63183.1 PLP-dependent aminotransferase family protein [Pseudothauera nasutitermitis]
MAEPLPPGLARQQLLYQRLRAAIVEGRLPAGTRLPASRALAVELGIARNTVLYAYEQLVAEGCLTAGRQGTRVARLASARPLEGMPRAGHLPGLARRAASALRVDGAVEIDTLLLAPGVPDLTLFPFRAWRACLERAWRAATPRQLGYASHGGEPGLRAALAAHLSAARGFAVHAEQVVITAGTQAGLDACARLLADAGDMAWVENPGYPAARAALELAGLRLHALPVDEAGMAPAARDWREAIPRLILLTPSHQYPTGRVMSLARRLELLDGARAAGAWIIEDDYDCEFRRGGPALPALYGLRAEAPVVYAGTFSKTLYPGLRIGYLVVPRALAADFARAAGQATRPGHGVEQAALADFIQRGHYTAHLRRVRRHYEQRQRALRAALARRPGAETAVGGGEAGLHLLLWLPPDCPDVEVARHAAALGLGVRPLSRYTVPPLRCNGLVLGYGSLDERQADEAVRRLRVAMARAAG